MLGCKGRDWVTPNPLYRSNRQPFREGLHISQNKRNAAAAHNRSEVIQTYFKFGGRKLRLYECSVRVWSFNSKICFRYLYFEQRRTSLWYVESVCRICWLFCCLLVGRIASVCTTCCAALWLFVTSYKNKPPKNLYISKTCANFGLIQWSCFARRILLKAVHFSMIASNSSSCTSVCLCNSCSYFIFYILSFSQSVCLPFSKLEK